MKALLEQWDLWIRQGKISLVRGALSELNRNRLARHDLHRVSNLARRAGMAHLSVRLLNPIVRSRGKLAIRPTVEEKSEYAAALIDIGTPAEALKILSELTPSENPETLLFQAFAYFSQWNYSDAISPLRKFVSLSNSDYRRLVGKVNLAAALVTCRQREEASFLLEELRNATKSPGLELLHANCLELSAQLEFGAKKFRSARGFLERASALSAGKTGLSGFLVRKWAVYLDLAAKRPTTEHRRALDGLKSEAEKIRHWEGARDCDLQWASAAQDGKLFNHLYHGTPFDGFRQRIRAEMKENAISQTYLWQLGPKKSADYFDTLLGRDKSGERVLKVGQLPLRLFQTLASDYYAPFRIATLYSKLFPDEHFNPESSPLRVHQILDRLRKWFVASGVPLQIAEQSGYYRLRGTAPYSLKSSLNQYLRSPIEVVLSQFETRLKGREFSARELADAAGWNLRRAQRFIKQAESEDRLTVRGRRRGARYKMK